MALSGLEIYKLLPKTNCRECGFSTCLAFAMQLAKKAVALDKCPFLTEESKKILEELNLPAIKLITIGKNDQRVQIGNENVLFRHEERFYNPPGIGIIINDDLAQTEVLNIIRKIKDLEFERIGQRLKIELLAIRNRSSEENFLKTIDLVVHNTSFALVLMCEEPRRVKKVLELYKDLRPLIYRITPDNFLQFSQLLKGDNVPVVVWSEDLEGISYLTQQLNRNQINELVLEVSNKSPAFALWQLTQIRRLSLKKKERSLGYPVLVLIENQDKDLSLLFTVSYIAKYAGIILLDTFSPEDIFGILTLRQNIYTDPQKPLQIEPKLYSIGSVNTYSPVLVTTNFSLTYYTVLGEVEASRVPSYILSVNTEGMSVLTAWAAEKFTPESIIEAIEKSELKKFVNHNRIIIPGYVAMMSGDLQEKSGWQVIVGPREAAGIPRFLRDL
ncbi:MAG: acetyl-CoA decarbonylase/synthase complex subunit gamma [Candidatus Omnitrophica bacterium]|nr:acetyl-CoA decarbonylase/synthase complex subunit gamma [Candidatus Omnitrophota bacterium]